MVHSVAAAKASLKRITHPPKIGLLAPLIDFIERLAPGKLYYIKPIAFMLDRP